MSREQAQNIIRDIEKRGFRAYLVGGCVRDLLLGRMPEDWDIASSARPEQIMVDLVVFLRKNIKNGQEPGRGI